MENTNCEMVKDLLPLYVDDVASDTSRRYVEEHIATCEECKRLLEQMQSTRQLPVNSDMRKKEAESIKSVKKRIAKRICIAVFITAALVIAVVGIIVAVRHNIKHNNEINIMAIWDENGSEVFEFSADGTVEITKDLKEANLVKGNATYYFSYIDVVRIIQGNGSVEMRVRFSDNQYKNGHMTLYLMDEPYLELDQE